MMPGFKRLGKVQADDSLISLFILFIKSYLDTIYQVFVSISVLCEIKMSCNQAIIFTCFLV